MRRTRSAKALVAQLKEKIKVAEQRKKELVTYLQKLEEKYLNKEVSYSTYVEIIHRHYGFRL